MPAPHAPIDDLRTHTKPVSLIQLAVYIGVTRRTLYTHIDKGALKVVRRGGVIRVTPKEARRYVGLAEPRPKSSTR